MANERGELAQYIPVPTEEYRLPHEGLSYRERVVLNTLAEAVREVGKIYVYQIQRHPQPYPHNVSDEKIRQAAETDTEIFSPYTVVEQDPQGSLKAIPYHVAFGPQLKKVSRLLEEASNVTYDPDLKLFLKTRAKNLLDGEYEESEKIWLTTPQTRLRIVIGPYDRYPDKRFNRKFYYGGFVDSLNEQTTDYHSEVVKNLVNAWEKSDLSSVVITRPEVRIRYGRTEVSAGLPAEIGMTGGSYPCQLEWREKYGTEIIVLEPAFIEKFYRNRLPLIRQMIAVEHRRYQSDENLLAAYGLFFDGHETTHALIRRAGDEERLDKEYIFMNEMGSTVIGLTLLKEIGLTNKQLEGIISVEFAFMADEYKIYAKGDRLVEDYLDGDAVIFNYLLEKGVITIDDGRIKWRDINLVYENLADLAKILEKILTQGNINEARALKRWASHSIIRELFPFKPGNRDVPPKPIIDDYEENGNPTVTSHLTP